MARNLPVYNLNVAFGTVTIDGKSYDIKMGSSWNMFFQQIVQIPALPEDLTPSGSPLQFQPNNGTIFIFDPTASITNIAIQRGDQNIDITAVRVIPVSISDLVTITYGGAAPTVKFFPRNTP